MAQIYFGITNLSVPVGSTFEVGVFLDAQGQSIAAIDSTLAFNDGLELIDVRDGNSLISLWLERPQVGTSAVSFSGITPGGFTGDRGELMVLVFEAKKPGEVRIEAQSSQILLNDGLGTPAEIVPAPIGLTVLEQGEVSAYEVPQDNDAPEAFTPLLVEQEQFGGWVVVFSTQDKGSGIAYYEIKEGLLGWKQAESPHLLLDQDLRSSISIRAVDEAGNRTVSRLPAANSGLWYESGVFWGILLVVIAAIGVIVATRRLWGKKLKLKLN